MSGKSIRRRRTYHLKWCRYLRRNQVPFANWQHRAPGCDNPRMSGFVRASDRLPPRRYWMPKFQDVPGIQTTTSALRMHDQTTRDDYRRSKRSRR
jgi:hypothetical protein